MVNGWSFNGPEPGGPESIMRKWKKERGYSLGYTAGFRTPGNQPEIERERDRERERERERDTGTKALMEQMCFNQHGMGIYTVL